ncbi:MAG: hypothetical protein Hals2KO_04400 [Halioglobus sp.]
MSRDTRREQGDALPLPEMKSPRQLDDKILAHARAQAPQQRVNTRHGWMSGLAAASVVGIAVMIALPTQDGILDTVPAPSREEAELAPAAKAPQADALVDRAADDVDSSALSSPTAEPLQAVSRQASVPPAAAFSEAQALSAAQTLSDTQPLSAAQALPDKQASERKIQAGAAAKKLERVSPGPAMESVPGGTAKAAPPESSSERDQEARGGALHEDAIAAALETCAALLRSDDRPGATRCYAALRKDCGDCTLPPTLDAALEAQAANAVTSPSGARAQPTPE